MAQGDNIGTHGQSFFGYAGFAFEGNGSYGTAVDPSVFSDIISDGFEGDNGNLYLSTIRSRGTFYGTAGPYEDSGSLEMAAAPENGFGYLLKGAFGDETLTTEDPGGTGSPTVGHHQFSTAPLLPSLTVELGVGDIQAVQHVGTGIDTIELEHAAEEYLTASFETISKEPQLQSSLATPTFATQRPFVYHDGSFTFSGDDRSIDLQEATFSLENDLEGQYRTDRTIQFINVGQRTIEDEIVLDFTNDDIWKKFLGGSNATEPQNQLFEGNLSATWTSPETIPNTNVNYELNIELPRVVIESHTANLSETEQIAEEVTYRALIDTSKGYSAAMTLTNGRTTEY